jgi:hypothetical protein
MEVIGFTSWNPCSFVDNSTEAHDAVIRYLKKKGYAYGGFFHQMNEGVPMLDNHKVYQVSNRDWGDLIAEVVEDHDQMAYMKYAWAFALPSLGGLPHRFSEKIYDHIDLYLMGYIDKRKREEEKTDKTEKKEGFGWLRKLSRK